MIVPESAKKQVQKTNQIVNNATFLHRLNSYRIDYPDEYSRLFCDRISKNKNRADHLLNEPHG